MFMTWRFFVKISVIFLISGFAINACNFSSLLPGAESTSTFTPTVTLAATQVETGIPPTQQVLATTQTPINETPTLTSSATSILAPTPTFTPVPTFTPAPTHSSTTTGVQGQVTIVKPSRAMPIGGAAVTLYDDKTDDDLFSTSTVMDGSYRITQVPSGKYYLVVVWILSNSGAWPCADEKIPASGNKFSWQYEDSGLPIYVEITTRSNGNIVVAISTGSFGVSGTRKTVDIPLICNQLK
jgi:hypothetical protein